MDAPLKNAILPDVDQARNALRVKLFSDVAHDVKTPLVSIIGSLSALDQMSDKLSLEQRNMLIKTALTEAYRLDDFFTQMLNKAKP